MSTAIVCRRHQAGLAAVEFALVAALILFPLLFGIMEFGRVLFYWNAATEATRLGARMAVVCDIDDSTIKSRMSALFPVIDASHIEIAYKPDGCATDTCSQVVVSIAPMGVPTYIPFIPTDIKFAPFRTTLPRESMRSNFQSVDNPVCL